MRWQVRKSAPFPIEEAQCQLRRRRARRTADASSSSRWRGATSSREYESVCRTRALHAGLVDLATFNVVNAVLAAGGAPPGDWLLVNVAPDYLTRRRSCAAGS